MNSIKQYLPRYIDERFPRPTIEFANTQALLAIDFVQNWTTYHRFYRFCLNTPDKLLMVELDQGRVWVVVGYLTETTGIELPEWDHLMRPETR
jgi:hypothetical protein